MAYGSSKITNVKTDRGTFHMHDCKPPENASSHKTGMAKELKGEARDTSHSLKGTSAA